MASITIEKNAREDVRLGISEYKGKMYLQLRVWYPDSHTGEMRPSHEGFTLQPSKLPELITALQQLEAQARHEGILPTGVEDL